MRGEAADDVVARREERGGGEREHEADRAEGVRTHRLTGQGHAPEDDQHGACDQRAADGSPSATSAIVTETSGAAPTTSAVRDGPASLTAAT